MSDRWTNPIAGVGSDFLLPAAQVLLNTLVPAFDADANIMILRFAGALGVQIGQFTDDGDNPSASVGSPIYGGDEWEVTRASRSKTRIIAIGTPVNCRTEQYKTENPYNK